MFVHYCNFSILIYDSFSLKDKRSVVKSIINKSKQKFNISISELNSLDIQNKADIGIACVGNTSIICEQTIQSFTTFVENNYNIDILRQDCQFAVLKS
ncbi:hypothetical protein EDC19_2604 [Natranaerovirga hydrolytica]|uniref:DUF503 domain-containing protein n=1 Tax=Natranaerovirga hydrolytica TaxID=680378 RepID=A0A4R1M840_9FIRM|nr:DUF503 domain-containing protein [Natranaerovirga hydrolytica]TCK87957.1 hypothetical protein EDC19_2604 [Natranaerovirga hydrolytica]